MMNVPQYQGVRFAFEMAESARQPVLPLQRYCQPAHRSLQVEMLAEIKAWVELGSG